MTRVEMADVVIGSLKVTVTGIKLPVAVLPEYVVVTLVTVGMKSATT